MQKPLWPTASKIMAKSTWRDGLSSSSNPSSKDFWEKKQRKPSLSSSWTTKTSSRSSTKSTWKKRYRPTLPLPSLSHPKSNSSSARWIGKFSDWAPPGRKSRLRPCSLHPSTTRRAWVQPQASPKSRSSPSEWSRMSPPAPTCWTNQYFRWWSSKTKRKNWRSRCYSKKIQANNSRNWSPSRSGMQCHPRK